MGSAGCAVGDEVIELSDRLDQLPPVHRPALQWFWDRRGQEISWPEPLDGLFLVITALLIALCFGIYVIYMIRRAMESAKPPAPSAKTGAATSAAKPAAVQS